MSYQPVMRERTSIFVEDLPAAGDVANGQYLTPSVDATEETVLLVSPKAFDSSFTPPPFAARAVGPAGRVRKSTVVVLCLIAFVLALLVRDPAVDKIAPLSTSVQDAYRKLNRNMPWTRAAFHRALHEPPRTPLIRENMFVRKPQEDHLMTMIVLHDLKAPEHDNLPFHHLLAGDFPFIKFVYPEGRNITVSIYGDQRPGWYDVRDADDLHFNEDEQGMVESQRQINQIITEERDLLRNKGKEPRIVLAGWSQGAAMALMATLTADEPIDALILMSAYIPMPEKLVINSALTEDKRRVPIFWGHGRHDPDITVEHAAEDVRALRQPPYALENMRFRVRSFACIPERIYADFSRGSVHRLMKRSTAGRDLSSKTSEAGSANMSRRTVLRDEL